MYIKVGNDFADGDFNYLSKYLYLLDVEISKIREDIKNSRDPESDGLCDYGEYLIGHGFVAIQRYITSTYPLIGISKPQALSIEPQITNDLTFVEALNAGANYWKHLEEWGLKAIIERDTDKLTGQAKATIGTIEKVTPWDDYTCANLLAVLLNGKEMKFSLLLPKISEWRNNLDLCRKQA